MALHLSGFTTRQGNRKHSTLQPITTSISKSCGSRGSIQVAGGNNGPTSCYPTLYTNPYENTPPVADMLSSAINNPPNMETIPTPLIYEHQPQSVRLYLDSSSNNTNNPMCSLVLKPPTNTSGLNLNPNLDNCGVDGTIAYFEKQIVPHGFEDGNRIVMELPNSTTALSSTSPYQTGSLDNHNLSAILYVVGESNTMFAPGLKKALDASISYGAPRGVGNAVYSQFPLRTNGTLFQWSSRHGAYYNGTSNPDLENLWVQAEYNVFGRSLENLSNISLTNEIPQHLGTPIPKLNLTTQYYGHPNLSLALRPDNYEILGIGYHASNDYLEFNNDVSLTSNELAYGWGYKVGSYYSMRVGTNGNNLQQYTDGIDLKIFVTVVVTEWDTDGNPSQLSDTDGAIGGLIAFDTVNDKTKDFMGWISDGTTGRWYSLTGNHDNTTKATLEPAGHNGSILFNGNGDFGATPLLSMNTTNTVPVLQNGVSTSMINDVSSLVTEVHKGSSSTFVQNGLTKIYGDGHSITLNVSENDNSVEQVSFPKLSLLSQTNTPGAITIGAYAPSYANDGADQTIKIENTSGNAPDAISMDAQHGGVSMNAHDDITLSGTNTIILSTQDILLCAGETSDACVNMKDGGIDMTANSNINILSTNSTEQSSIQLDSALGGINLTAADEKTIHLSSGKVNVASKDNVPDAISLTTSSTTVLLGPEDKQVGFETIALRNFMGTGDGNALDNLSTTHKQELTSIIQQQNNFSTLTLTELQTMLVSIGVVDVQPDEATAINLLNEHISSLPPAINIVADNGGIGLSWHCKKELNANGGRALVTANDDTSDAIKLHACNGSNQTIRIVNDFGSTDTAIDIETITGGVKISGKTNLELVADTGNIILNGTVQFERGDNNDRKFKLQSNELEFDDQDTDDNNGKRTAQYLFDQINQLQQENQTLQQENDTLTANVQNLQISVDDSNLLITSLQSALATLTDRVAQLEPS
jgi:hypothetical protein